MTLTALLGAIRRFYDEATGPAEDIADIRQAIGRLGEPIACQPDPASRAALTWLPAAGVDRFGELCRLVIEAGESMSWHYSYGENESLVTRIAFADLVGPAGPYVCDELRLGLTLVAPRTLYPMHAHPARELYYVVAGRALWTAGTTSEYRVPGEYVLHPSGVAHAMQTEVQALLAIYSWRGDIKTPPYYTDPA